MSLEDHTTEFQTHRYLNIHHHLRDYYHHILPTYQGCHLHKGCWGSHLDRHRLPHHNYQDRNQNHRYMHFTRYILSLHNMTLHLDNLQIHIFAENQVTPPPEQIKDPNIFLEDMIQDHLMDAYITFDQYHIRVLITTHNSTPVDLLGYKIHDQSRVMK